MSVSCVSDLVEYKKDIVLATPVSLFPVVELMLKLMS